ncbi:hypothetical protein NIES39_C05250 [Arthrospira platensis NIES-39]|nr:hypothetical protein NIES39_C05250 [Arthrospira platensis NIES-39]
MHIRIGAYIFRQSGYGSAITATSYPSDSSIRPLALSTPLKRGFNSISENF